MMKKIIILGLILFGFIYSSFSQTTYTWNAPSPGPGIANSASNWLVGAGSGTVPTVPPSNSDNVVFNNGSIDCTWDIGTINSFSVFLGYGGTIAMGTNQRDINGDFVLNAGTLNSTTSNLNFFGSKFILGGGTFNSSGGTVRVFIAGGTTTEISGGFIFNNLQVRVLGSLGSQRNLDFGSGASINNLSLDPSGDNKTFSYQGNVNILTSLIINGGNSNLPINNTANFNFTGTGAKSITGGSSGVDFLPNLVFNTTGNISVSGQINVQGNWTADKVNLLPGSSTVNFYGNPANISGDSAAFHNLNIETGAVVNMPSNAEVKVGGTLTRTGTLNFQTTTALGLNGSVTQTISGSAITLAGLKTYSTAATRSIIIDAPIAILDSLKVGANANVTIGSGSIKLSSTSTLTARLARIDAGGLVTGSVTVETFIPGGDTDWANLGVRGVMGQTIADWDTWVSPASTSGIPMTCTGCLYSPTVTGTGSSTFVSVRGWDETTFSYPELVPTSPLTEGKGFWIYVGDGSSTTGGLTTINTGSLVQGTVSTPLTISGSSLTGFNLVANPYASPITWTTVLGHVGQTANLVSNTIYVYNADLGTNTTFNFPTSSPGGPGSLTNIIPGGQGFYVEAVAAFPLNFKEEDKLNGSGSSSPLLKSTASSELKLVRIGIQGLNDKDETVLRFMEDALSGHDKLDARKRFQSPGYVGYPAPYDKYTTISSKDNLNNDYCINSLPPLTQSLSIPILARVSTSGTYTINAFDFQDFAMCVNLHDKLTNSYHDLRLSPYVFTISDSTSAPRFELILCKDESLNAVGIAEKKAESTSIFINQDAQGAYVKTVFEKNTKATISVYNVIGQKLLNDISVEGIVTTTPLPIDLHHQVVLIKVTTDKESVTKKVVLH